MPLTHAKYKAIVLEAAGYGGLRERVRELSRVTGKNVLVRYRFASLNFRDLQILHGRYPHGFALPVVPLSDASGEVVTVGADATRWKIGDRVVPIFKPGWHRGSNNDPASKTTRMLGGTVDGTAQEYGIHDEDDLVSIPASLSLEDAAAIPTAGVTAWHALVYLGKIKAGDTVLTLGSGGVSVFAIQIAKMSGARVIATSSDKNKMLHLKRLGADETISYSDHPAWDRSVLDLTGGRGVDHVVEVGGLRTFEQSLRATRDGGHVAAVGNLTGTPAPPSAAIGRAIRLSILSTGSREMYVDLLQAMLVNSAHPVIDSKFPLSDLEAALRHLESRKHLGKILITL